MLPLLFSIYQSIQHRKEQEPIANSHVSYIQFCFVYFIPLLNRKEKNIHTQHGQPCIVCMVTIRWDKIETICDCECEPVFLL